MMRPASTSMSSPDLSSSTSSSSASSSETVSRIVFLFAMVMLVSMSSGVFFVQQVFFGHWSVSPTRCFLVTFTPLLLTAYGLLRGSLSRSGAVVALWIGVVLTLAHAAFTLALMAFFLTASKATRFREAEKRRIEGAAFKKGGRRNWAQVVCNGGVATELALIYLLDVGSAADLPMDFATHYRSSWIGAAILGALACCNGDTWASELGSVWTDTAPRLLTNLRKVPRGTNGGVSLAGLGFSFVGGALVGIGYYLGVLLSWPWMWRQQAAIVLIGGAAGLFGSLVDSFLGAVLQFSGVDESTGAIVEEPGPGVKPISGYPMLDNHAVNLLSSLVTAFAAPLLAAVFF